MLQVFFIFSSFGFDSLVTVVKLFSVVSVNVLRFGVISCLSASIQSEMRSTVLVCGPLRSCCFSRVVGLFLLKLYPSIIIN